MTLVEPGKVTAPTSGAPNETGHRVVGRSPVQPDFVAKVAGTIQYAADWALPGLLHARLVRSDLPSARIVSIDTSAATKCAGVVAVLTAADVPNNDLVEMASGGLVDRAVAMPVLAADRVRYVGEPLAVVVAVSQQAADGAAELVMVEYDELPGVFDMEQALDEAAHHVHDGGNLVAEWAIEAGDVEAGFTGADVVVRGEYRTQHVEHAYLEPETGVGWMDNGVVTIRSSTQVIEHASALATLLGLPQSQVRLIAAYMGGGFGGKEDMTVEPFIALAVFRTGRPVRMIWDRQESMIASSKRHPFVMRYRTGARQDGTIVAQHIDILGDAGAYPTLSARVLFAAAAVSTGPYRVPNVRIRSRAVFTNHLPTGAFRGFGAMQVVFGYEAQIDEVAAATGVAATVVRERNFLARGDLLPAGDSVDTDVEVEATMAQVVAALGERRAPSAPTRRVGRGLACNRHPYGRTVWFHDRASAWLSLQPDGALIVRCGVTDVGAGQAASLGQLAAEVVGVSLDRITVYIGDSALTPPAGGTFATRQLYMSGNAVVHAARRLRARLEAIAAELLSADAGELTFEDDHVVAPDGRGRLSHAELVAACRAREVPVDEIATWHAEKGTFDVARGRGSTFPDYTYGTHGADVEVDVDTGEIHVLRYVACHDVGRAIHPARVAGQIQGAVAQGLGYALSEECCFVEGFPTSPLFSTYLMPNAVDTPNIEAIALELGEGKGPMGARGIGEPPIGNVAATIASAVADAIGVRPAQLPITPERVLELLGVLPPEP